MVLLNGNNHMGKITRKRYQYWGFENEKPQIMWTEWFPWNSINEEQIQLKGFKGNDLKNDYK